MSEMIFNPLVPELDVSNLERSLNFYRDVLGFQVVFERPEDKFVFIQLERVQLMLQQETDNTWKTGALEFPYGRGINFEMGVRDVDGILERLAAANHPLFRPLTRNEYRAGETINVNIEFLVQDPDGYLLRFAQDNS
jgi:catechol 2,3-dioxygenase-like lactoylglutathione lyase family enzyme